MKKGTKSYQIFKLLKAFDVDVTKVYHKTGGRFKNKGFYGQLKGEATFLGYNKYSIRQKIIQGLFDKYKS